MRAVVLAGGKGARLKPYTVNIPKPLVPVGEQPILGIMLTRLKAAGVQRVTIAVNHMAEIVMACFGAGERYGLRIDYSLEKKSLSTVAPIKLIGDLPKHFFVMNGDVLTDLSFVDLYKSHVESGCKLTTATFRRDSKIDFGVLDIDESLRRAVGFREKPTYQFTVSMGIYVYSQELLERVPSDRPFGFDDLVLDMLRDGDPINIYTHGGYWLDIGRPDDYEQANVDIESFMSRPVT